MTDSANRMFTCRLCVFVVATDGAADIEKVVSLPFAPRSGDYVYDESARDGTCLSQEGIRIERVGVDAITGSILLDCGREQWDEETLQVALKSYPGFEQINQNQAARGG